MSKKLIYPAFSVLAAASLALTGCSSPVATPAPSSPVSATPFSAAGLTVSQPWVKAAASGMTGGFGVIKNTTDADVTITGASTPAARKVELHETVAGTTGGMQMRAKDGGFVVPAGGELKLEPGANHLMLMGLAAPVTAGTEVTFTLALAGGETFTFTALVKDFSGANENYVEGSASSPVPSSSSK